MSEPTPSSTPPERPVGDTPADPATGPIHPVAAPQYGPPPGYVLPPQPVQRQSRVPLIAAWVGIAAGAVFIVAIIFGTGFMLGAHSGAGHRGGPDRGDAMAHRGEGPPPQVFPMGPMLRPGPGFVFPGGPGGNFGPGGPGGVFGPGGPDGSGGSGQTPSTLPTPPR